MKNGSSPSDSAASCQLEQEHRHDRADRDRQVARDRAGVSVTTDCTPPTSFGQSALDLAGLRLGEEAQRHALEVRVERAAQVLHDVLADDVVEVALPDADEPRDDRGHDHQPDVQVQLVVVAADDDLVDEDLSNSGFTRPIRLVTGSRPGRRGPRPGTDGRRRGSGGPSRCAPLQRHRDELLRGAAPHAPAHRPGSAPAAAPPPPAAPPVAARVWPPRECHQVLCSIRPTLAREWWAASEGTSGPGLRPGARRKPSLSGDATSRHI